MPAELSIQMQHESDSWKRKLVFLSDENTYLKSRLISLLKNDNAELLSKAEEFNEGFLTNDEMINMLQMDIAEFDRLLNDGHSGGYTFISHLISKLVQMRIETNTAEKHFNALKDKFNDSLVKVLQARIN